MREKVFPNARIMKAPKNTVDSYFRDTISEGEHALTIKSDVASVNNTWVHLQNLDEFCSAFRDIGKWKREEILDLQLPGALTIYNTNTMKKRHQPEGGCLVCNRNNYQQLATQDQTAHFVALNDTPRNGVWIHSECRAGFVSFIEEIPNKISLEEILAEQI